MSEPFIAEVRIFAGNFAPRGWAFCNGQLLPIAQNTALFSLIGTTYGGDGRTTTALPNLQGRAPMGSGRGPGLTARRIGQRTGVEMVTLTEAQMPNHPHTLRGYAAPVPPPVGAPGATVTLARTRSGHAYQTSASTGLVPLADQTLPNAGGSHAHNSLQPYLVLNFIIALQGLYPSRS